MNSYGLIWKNVGTDPCVCPFFIQSQRRLPVGLPSIDASKDGCLRKKLLARAALVRRSFLTKNLHSKHWCEYATSCSLLDRIWRVLDVIAKEPKATAAIYSCEMAMFEVECFFCGLRDEPACEKCLKQEGGGFCGRNFVLAEVIEI